MIYSFDPIYNKDSRVLILGSMASVKSLEMGFYYMLAKYSLNICGIKYLLYIVGSYVSDIAIKRAFAIARIYNIHKRNPANANFAMDVARIRFDIVQKSITVVWDDVLPTSALAV